MNRCYTFNFLLLSLLSVACTVRPPLKIASKVPSVPDKPSSPATFDGHCSSHSSAHAIFSISVDGSDVGREVRSTSIEKGPLGPERVISSHLVMHMKMGNAHFDTQEVRSERTLLDSGLLLRGSLVSIDQIKSRTYLVGYNGKDWDRLVETRSSVTVPLSSKPTTLSLSGSEVIGGRLLDLLRDVAFSKPDAPHSISYYEPLLNKPIPLVFSKPLKGVTSLHGKKIEGKWVEARRLNSNQTVSRVFFDNEGRLWVVEYPEIHQVRRRMPGPLTLSSETSELLVGLHSETYISDPNSASYATYLLTSTPDRLDSLALLGQPLNHVVKRKSPNELVLKVRAGSPDGLDPPTEADLGTSTYVQPKSPSVIGALRYLRSAGRRGNLSIDRRNNATPVIALASLLRKPKLFWSDSDEVARLIMKYVNALLPDKKHTFSMADASLTLEKGAGDCTEHAVLFASLMRAQGIPTRLVTGMVLFPGGIWGYHMWNTYWDGTLWQPIDVSTLSYRPGALYVALGRSIARFDNIRDRLANFMWRTFNGISFNLVEASNNGETLSLARPRNHSQNPGEMALFNAVVLSARGDHDGALSLLDKNIPKQNRSLSVKLMRIELLVRSGHHKKALSNIDSLRRETSAPANLVLLDKLELQSLLTMGLLDKAERVFSRIDDDLLRKGRALDRTLLQANYLFGSKKEAQSIQLLSNALLEHPDDTRLLIAFTLNVATTVLDVSQKTLEQALESGRRAAHNRLLSDHEVLTSLAQILIRVDRQQEAGWILDHALILAPFDQTLHELEKKIPKVPCPDGHLVGKSTWNGN